MAVAISSAELSGATITVVGSGFGSKSTAAPHRYLPWTGLTNGSDASGQFDDIEFVGTNFSAADFTVDNSVGFGVGAGSLRINYDCFSTTPETSELFPHHEFSLPGVDYFRMSYRVRVERTTDDESGGTYFQIKGARSGPGSGGSGPKANYDATPWIGFSLVTYTPANDGDINVEGHAVSPGGSDSTWTNNGNPSPPLMSDDLYHFIEFEKQLGTVGSNTDTERLWIDGILIAETTNKQIRTADTQHFNYVQHAPGFANHMTYNDWLCWESRHYLDTTRAQAFVAQESTASAVTHKFLLPPSAWSGTGLTLDDADMIPAGYNYLYVMDEDGAINSGGFAYTAGAGGAVIPVFMNHYRNQGIA
jgi:hypothetical protein